MFGAARVTLDGRVDGDVLGRTGSYTRRGTVGGTEDVTIPPPCQGGGRRPSRTGCWADSVGSSRCRPWPALLLWLVPWSVEGAAHAFRQQPWTSTWVGVLALIGSVVAVVAIVVVAVLAILLGLLGLGGLVGLTTFGAAVAIVLLVFLLFVTLAYAAQAAVGVTLAGLVLGPATGLRRWGALVLSVLVVVILTSLPFVGGWLTFVVAVLGLGALLLAVIARRPRAATST